MKSSGYLHIILFLGIVSATACKVKLTLSGQSIPADAKTVSIAYFANRASLASPTLPQIITENLRDKFQRETRLRVVNGDADLAFEGTITGYAVTPLAQQGEQAALTRLTITISVVYVNNLDEKQNFTTNFSRFADFPATQSLSSVEGTLIDDIVIQLSQDVFNKAFINW